MTHLDIPEDIFIAYQHLGVPLRIDPISLGLINKTYVVSTQVDKYVLQEVSPIFATTVTEDSLAVSFHLQRANINTPMPLFAVDNQLFVVHDGRVFRALKFIAGRSIAAISSPKLAQSAGVVLGRFHYAMMDFVYNYKSLRRHCGDYDFHRENLVAALREHDQHEYFFRVKPLAESMIDKMAKLNHGLYTTKRHIHGDPKVSNILFDDEDQGICLVDFDTLGNHGWSLEMGDALRSWCNPFAEDHVDAHVDLALAKSALQGYASIMRGQFLVEEIEEMLAHVQAVSLCLAMRYLADVLNEKYFNFDRERFSRAADHHWLRANAMYTLSKDFTLKQSEIGAMARDLLL